MLLHDYEYLQKHKLGLDDTFQFHCKSCGKCCKYRNDVLLTPYDLFRIARYFGRNPVEIVSSYCECYDGPGSHLPVVQIKPVQPNNACPFLRNKKCAVHLDKPIVCAAYPLAKVSEPQDDPYYILQNISCGQNDRTVSVRQWLGKYCNEESNIFDTRWAECVTSIATALQEKWSQLNNEGKGRILNFIFCKAYLDYDTNKEFIPQFESNAMKIFAGICLDVNFPCVPKWVSIESLSSKEIQYNLLLRKAYGLYKQDWGLQHGLNYVETELVASGNRVINAAPPKSLDLFGSSDFYDSHVMKSLLNKEDISIWKQLIRDGSGAQGPNAGKGKVE